MLKEMIQGAEAPNAEGLSIFIPCAIPPTHHDTMRHHGLFLALCELEEIREMTAGIADAVGSDRLGRLLGQLWGKIDGCCLRLAPLVGAEIDPGEPPMPRDGGFPC